MRLLLAVTVVGLLPAAAYCQTMVESALLSGAVAGSGSGAAAATGSAVSRSLGSIDSALSRAAGTGTTGGPGTSVRRAGQPRAVAAPSKPLQAAFDSVEPGTYRTELIAKAGKPQFAIASSDDEVLRYTTKEGGGVRILIVDGKVSSIEHTPPKSAPISSPTPSADPGR